MAVERKKEKQKTPAELAAEQKEPKQAAKPKTEESSPAKRSRPTRGRAPRKPSREKASAAAKPAPAQRQRERETASRPVVRAQAKYVRSSARKARLVIEHIRGRSIEDARAVLRHTPRAVAKDLEKLLNSAVANAENNHELVGDDLVVKDVYADEGPTIKRFRPRALGRATRIRKRTSHLTLTLTPKD
jgi:large subunit ribosomal protein L22